MAEWDVVSTAPAAPAADPWAVVSHEPAPQSKLESLGKNISQSPLTGAGDLLLHHVTGMLSSIPGMIAGSGASVGKLFGANVDPDKVQADTEAYFTHQPVSQSGQEGLATEQAGLKKAREIAAPVIEPASAGYNDAMKAFGPTLEPYARDIVHGVVGGAGNALALTPLAPEAKAVMSLADVAPAERAAFEARAPSGVAAPPPASSVVEGAAKPVVGTGSQAVETGRAAGFKFTPGGVESRDPARAVAGDVPQSFAVNANDRRAINLHNNAQAVKLAGEQIGVKDATTLSKKNFDDARQPHFDTYDETGAKLGTGLKGSDAFTSTLEAQLADVNPQSALKATVVPQVKRILAAAQSKNMSGPQLVKDISWLRANGGRSVANTLENEVETQLGANSPQLTKFREARTGLAQIHQLQQAAPGGIINARVLSDFDRKNPGVLTGNLKLIAQSAAAAPQDFILPSGVQPGSSPLSKPTWAGVGKAVAGKVAKFVAPGKFDVQSDAFQNRFGREASPTEATYFKDLGKRPAAPSAGFELQPSPGKAFSPNQRDMGPLSEGPGPREQLSLTSPEGSVFEPHQLGMQVAQGLGPRESLQLKPADGTVGVNPVQLGMEVAQGRPLPDQRLGLQQTPSGIEPHQPSLLGHEGTPEGGSRKQKPKAKKAKKDGTD